MMTLVVGTYEEHERKNIRDAAQRAGSECTFVPSVPRAIATLRTLEEPPRCIMASFAVDIATLVEFLRDQVDLYSVPVIALVPNPSSEAYRAANQLGADDSITEHDTGGITRRIANLLQGAPPRLPTAEAGRVLVGVQDPRRRRTVGKKLRSAGYEVDFVAGAAELHEKSRGPVPPALLVTSPSFPPGSSRINSDDDHTHFPEVTLPTSAWSPTSQRMLTEPEVEGRLMFLVEEATRDRFTDLRASRRIQHSSICAFRTTRTFEPTYALTDNISRQGLYVRTMDPPSAGSEVRIDLRDNYGEVLQLRGTVAWRHAPSRVGGTTSPGFGVRINEEACSASDLTKYRALYDALLEELESLERPLSGPRDTGAPTSKATIDLRATGE